MTPTEFLTDPEAQDLTAQLKITQLLKIYPPEAIAKIWLTGSANPKSHWRDVHGTNARIYKQRFNRYYKQ